MSETKPEIYKEHEGTVRISGKTLPKRAGLCAFTYLKQGMQEIDFFYIGANAGQQAMKAMSIFSFLVEKEAQDTKVEVTFRPMRFLTLTDADGVQKEKDATVWRTILVEKNFTSKE